MVTLKKGDLKATTLLSIYQSAFEGDNSSATITSVGRIDGENLVAMTLDEANSYIELTSETNTLDRATYIVDGSLGKLKLTNVMIADRVETE